MRKYLRNIIKEEIDNIFEAFEFRNEENYIPTEKIAQIASLALSAFNLVKQRGWKIENPNSNEGDGSLKAKYLSEKQPQTFADMKRLKAYFDNNEAKVQESRKKHGIDSSLIGTKKEMTRGQDLLMWNLHGGDECKNWVNAEIDKSHETNLKTKKIVRDAGGAGVNKGMGSMGAPKDPTNTRIHR